MFGHFNLFPFLDGGNSLAIVGNSNSHVDVGENGAQFLTGKNRETTKPIYWRVPRLPRGKSSVPEVPSLLDSKLVECVKKL